MASANGGHRLCDDCRCPAHFSSKFDLSSARATEETKPSCSSSASLQLCLPLFFFFNTSCVRAPQGVHGGGRDVPGRGDQGDQPDQSPQTAPHAAVAGIEASGRHLHLLPSHPYVTIAQEGPPPSAEGFRSRNTLLFTYGC